MNHDLTHATIKQMVDEFENYDQDKVKKLTEALHGVIRLADVPDTILFWILSAFVFGGDRFNPKGRSVRLGQFLMILDQVEKMEQALAAQAGDKAKVQ